MATRTPLPPLQSSDFSSAFPGSRKVFVGNVPMREITLSGDEPKLLWVPPGFAHGYVVLSDTADFTYKVTAEYALGGAAGVPLRTVAISTMGVYALVAVLEGLVTALVVRGLLAVRAEIRAEMAEL